MIDKTLSHFRIVRKVGEGGMGVVYEAEDVELHRRVALKVMRREYLGKEDRRRRFVREARTAAKMSHPHIATIYEIGEAEGETFIAMEYIDGETLRERIAGKPLSIDEAMRVAVQVAEGLSAAHDAQVIHRDLKPENVMIAPDGRARILDFGLAKPLEEPERDRDATVALSGEGRILGTVAYMSPEQARGLTVDARSDHFSFGVMLYEMVTGQAAFQGDTPSDTLAHILRDQPPPSFEINPDVPGELERIIEKCLEKNPADRFQDTRDLVVDLRRLIRDSGTGSGSGELRSGWSSTPSGIGPAPASRRRLLVAALAASVLAVATLIVLQPWKPGKLSGGTSGRQANTMAVMPFQNMQEPDDPQRLGQILQELIITDLSGSEGLQVFSSQRLYDVQKQLGSAERQFDRETATRVAKTVGARTMLEGTLSRLGETWILTAAVVDVESGTVSGSCRVDGTDLYEMVDDISEHLHSEPSLALAEGSAEPVRDKTSTSLEAYRLYLTGADLLNREEYAAAADTLALAVDMDRDFGKAYYKLAVAQWWSGGSVEATNEEAKATLQEMLDRGLWSNRQERLMAEAVSGLIDRDWEAARSLYEQVTELYPEDKEAWYGLGEAQFHAGTTPDEITLASFERAVGLDPSFTLAYKHIFDCNMRLGHPEASLVRVQEYIAANPGKTVGYRWWVEVAHAIGFEEQMEAALAAARPRVREPAELRTMLVMAARASMERGDAVRARRLMEEAREADPDGIDFLWTASYGWIMGELADFDTMWAMLDRLEDQWPDKATHRWKAKADLLLLHGRDEELRQYLAEQRASEKYDKVAGELKFAHRLGGNEDEFRRVLDEQLAEAGSDEKKAQLLTEVGWQALESVADETKAMESFERALALDPDDGWLQTGVGWCHLRAGRLDEAEAAFRKAVEDSPGHVNPPVGLAAVEIARGRPAEAERILARLLERQVALYPVRWMSVALAEQGRFEEAESFGRRAVAMSPSPRSLGQLAWVLVEGGGDLDEAVQLATTARDETRPFFQGRYRILPVTPSPEHVLGLVAVKRGDLREGVALLEEAAKLRPDRERIREDLRRARALL